MTGIFSAAGWKPAWKFRQSLGFSNACRVVFGESDGLPGLTVDKFGDYLSFQTVSLGMEQWKPDIIEILVELFQPKGIYERNDVPVRAKEGLEQITGCVYGEVPPLTTIREHDAAMLVDIAHGQKTGHFLDQQENRGRIAPYCPAARFWICAAHTGGFSIHAALYGAASVESVDVSEEALQMVLDNAKANGVADKITTTCGNVFDIVRSYSDDGKQYGLVICDPPALCQEPQGVGGRLPGLQGAESPVHEAGGTGRISRLLLLQSVYDAGTVPQDAAGSRRRLRPVRRGCWEVLMQSRDHPATLNAEQSHYLKDIFSKSYKF